MDNQPQVIRIEPLKIAGSWKWEKDSDRIPSSIMIIDPKFDSNLLPSTLSPDICQYGQTYLKCPFDNRYFLIQDYENEIILAKISAIVDILADLGATRIKWETEMTGVEQRDIDEEFNGAIPQGNLNVHLSQKDSKAETYSFSSEWNYEGIGINQEGYAIASDRAKQCGLQNDLVISTLLNGRNPAKKTRNKAFKQSTCMSSELNSTLDLVCNLNALKGALHLDNAFRKATCIKKEYKTTFEVEFD